MKITTFLKKYSLIDNQFIDDFYSFYDEGKNEYIYNRDIIFPYTKKEENRTEFIGRNSSLRCSGELGLSVTLNIFSTI